MSNNENPIKVQRPAVAEQLLNDYYSQSMNLFTQILEKVEELKEFKKRIESEINSANSTKLDEIMTEIVRKQGEFKRIHSDSHREYLEIVDKINIEKEKGNTNSSKIFSDVETILLRWQITVYSAEYYSSLLELSSKCYTKRSKE